MLYERAKQLQAKRLSAEEIRSTLLSEGAKPEDVQVILGSLGFGPQPQPDPTKPLAMAKRALESRPMKLLVFLFGTAMVGGLGYFLWIIGTVIVAFIQGFGRGC